MSKREYIVGLHKGVDFDSFNNEITSNTGSNFIPNRSIEIANYRPGSERLIHYYLTDEEAQTLRLDPRVYCVEIPPNQREDLKIVKNLIQEGNFNKVTTGYSTNINWGLRRVISETNVYGTSNNVTGNFPYTLDGTGVDIVIQDSGIQADHPEFNDRDGNSRVQQINWYSSTGLPGTMPVNHYTDFDGHGTHVAGITSGLTYGWAKNSKIYAVKVAGLDAGEGGIPVTDCFDLIKVWHQNKPIDPTTGYKRPTIVNMSWGYQSAFIFINGGSYRGVPWTGTARRTDYGMVGFNIAGTYYYNSRVNSVDIDVQEMIDAGIHVVIAAGNSYQKIDIPTGLDYNNYFNSNLYGASYYHRGGSPYDNQAIIVGNIDSEVISIEKKADSSNTGPGVDIYAPGTNIVSTVSNTNLYSGISYPENTNFKIANLSGTSMASPQVAGVLALGVQINPGYTPDQAKNWLINQSKTNLILTSGIDNDYLNFSALLNSPNRFLYNPFSSAYALTIGSGI